MKKIFIYLRVCEAIIFFNYLRRPRIETGIIRRQEKEREEGLKQLLVHITFKS